MYLRHGILSGILVLSLLSDFAFAAAPVASPGTPVYLRPITPPAAAPSASAVRSAPAAQPAPVVPAAPAVDSLSVMTINLWHKDRTNEMRVMAQSLRTDLPRVPDIIFCQEVVFGRDSRLDNTAAVLAAFLGYQSRGTKRTSDKEGIAIISRFPFQYYVERHLDAQTSPLLIGFRRVSVMAEFNVPGIGLVRCVNVHFTNWGFEARIRGKQLSETLTWMADRELRVPAAVTIFGGDFNAERDSAEMAQMKQPRLAGRIRFCDFNSDLPTRGSPGNPNVRIDQLFVSATELPIRLVQEKLLWKDGLRDGKSHFYPSDHLAVVQTYSFVDERPLAMRPTRTLRSILAANASQGSAAAAPTTPAIPARRSGSPPPSVGSTGTK